MYIYIYINISTRLPTSCIYIHTYVCIVKINYAYCSYHFLLVGTNLDQDVSTWTRMYPLWHPIDSCRIADLRRVPLAAPWETLPLRRGCHPLIFDDYQRVHSLESSTSIFVFIMLPFQGVSTLPLRRFQRLKSPDIDYL